MLEDYEEAIIHLTNALKVSNNNLSCLNIRAYCYKALENWDLWLKDFDKIEFISKISSRE